MRGSGPGSDDASKCDSAAAAPHDPDRRAPGVAQGNISLSVAGNACAQEIAESGAAPRLSYQLGRALLAKHDLKGARRELELAVSGGYRAAQVDLAGLLVDAFQPDRPITPARCRSMKRPGGTACRLPRSSWASYMSAGFRAPLRRRLLRVSRTRRRPGPGIERAPISASPTRSHGSGARPGVRRHRELAAEARRAPAQGVRFIRGRCRSRPG